MPMMATKKTAKMMRPKTINNVEATEKNNQNPGCFFLCFVKELSFFLSSIKKTQFVAGVGLIFSFGPVQPISLSRTGIISCG